RGRRVLARRGARRDGATEWMDPRPAGGHHRRTHRHVHPDTTRGTSERTRRADMTDTARNGHPRSPWQRLGDAFTMRSTAVLVVVLVVTAVLGAGLPRLDFRTSEDTLVSSTSS